MKKFIVFSAAIFMIACQSNDKKAAGTLSKAQKDSAIADSTTYTTIEWLDSVHTNLGKMVKDQTIEVSFRFKNTGNKTLVFQNVSAPCGCTIPEKPEKPFAPGEEGVIRAKYNGSGNGHIYKQIFVKANTKPTTDHTLTFEGDMDEKK